MKTNPAAEPGDSRTPYQRFEDLARRLLGVSKEELDKRLAEYGRKKKGKKAREK
jgi:hypothetical protein